MEDLVGQQLGNYHLQALLGTGGYARVYQGEHTPIKMKVAIKVLKTREQLSKEEQATFLQEAQIIARLRHRHIIRILDFGIARTLDNAPFIVMTLASQGSLRHCHPIGSQVPLQMVVSYVKQVAEALQYAHNQHEPVIHCDIKPENMLVNDANEILLSDFGIAIIGRKTTEIPLTVENPIGTIGYMAPERFGGLIQKASDQYALAVVAYEWLAGRLPFTGNKDRIIFKHMQVPPPPLRQFCPQVPQEVENVILRALAKEAKKRYTSVEEFAQALEQAAPVPENTANLSDSDIFSKIVEDNISAQSTQPPSQHSNKPQQDYGPTQKSSSEQQANDVQNENRVKQPALGKQSRRAEDALWQDSPQADEDKDDEEDEDDVLSHDSMQTDDEQHADLPLHSSLHVEDEDAVPSPGSSSQMDHEDEDAVPSPGSSSQMDHEDEDAVLLLDSSQVDYENEDEEELPASSFSTSRDRARFNNASNGSSANQSSNRSNRHTSGSTKQARYSSSSANYTSSMFSDPTLVRSANPASSRNLFERSEKFAALPAFRGFRYLNYLAILVAALILLLAFTSLWYMIVVLALFVRYVVFPWFICLIEPGAARVGAMLVSAYYGSAAWSIIATHHFPIPLLPPAWFVGLCVAGISFSVLDKLYIEKRLR
jgi:serine/threonine protein kinase